MESKITYLNAELAVVAEREKKREEREKRERRRLRQQRSDGFDQEGDENDKESEGRYFKEYRPPEVGTSRNTDLRSYSPEDGCQLKMKSNLKDWKLAALIDRLLLMQGMEDFGEIFLELKERTMKLHNIIKEALNPLYLNNVHIQADQWLQDFQHTIDAWQV
ncbi:hypothetical protein MTR67_030971 [Solanum verrucosum]|uniref:Uncharacterized protein n=1 Tax=Solanum verrucosum TaxID=315347 RepID=A0AAF0U1M5_SOLVR|nr:hypothetical protein MTR67_030971 [Solanum verrucosum]